MPDVCRVCGEFPRQAWDRRCVMCADCRVAGDLRPVVTLRVKEDRL